MTQRPRPEPDPLGVRVGGFIVFPNATISESFVDNNFASDAATVDDFITNIIPEIVMKSDWRSHGLRFFGSADVGLSADRSNEDYEDIDLGAVARMDVLCNLKASALRRG